MAKSSKEAANATRGDGANDAHQLCFTGSAATRARTRISNAADGSIAGSSSSRPLTARNSFTRKLQAGQAERCFSTSSASLAFKRPSTKGKILLSIFEQLITTFLLCTATSLAAPRAGLVPLGAIRRLEKAATLARFPNIRESLKSHRNPAP